MTEQDQGKRKGKEISPEDGSDNETTLKYPVGAFFILAGYLLERFVYYGLFGGVVFYMQRVLQFSAPTSSTLKAVIEGLIYLAPIAGAVLADTYLGKFKTVFTMCCIYTIGALIFTLSSVTPIMVSVRGIQAAGMGGIFILGLSAGLMKAVYTSLGPDQFKVPKQRRQQQRFFYAFYWMINAGAFFGQILTAQLRSSVQCFGDDCYMLPYFILCGLMMISTIVFYSGKRFYYESPPDTMLLDSLKCLFHAGKKTFMDRSKPVEHWIDRAGDTYDANLIEDVKKTLRVLLTFITYPFFWALFYQTSTGMIFQAKRLYDHIGSYRIPPEVTSSINPFLILVLIPLFELVIYPFCDRRKILKNTTSRMVLGMVLACISFIIYGLVNIQVEQNIIGARKSQMNLYNARNCEVSLDGDWLPENIKVFPYHELLLIKSLKDKEEISFLFLRCGNISEKVRAQFIETHATTVAILPEKVMVMNPSKEYLKDKDAESKVRIITDFTSTKNEIRAPLSLIYRDLVKNISLENGTSDFKILSPQKYTIREGDNTLGYANIKQDGVYEIVITEEKSILFNLTKPSDTHMAWLFPQYLFLTTGEVLFSVSSMDFAYSEAPVSMKSVMQAANLFTITIGLWIFAIFTKLSVVMGVFEHRASNEAFTYAAGMAINTLVFFFLARTYTRQKELRENREDHGHDNAAFRDAQN